MAELDDLYENLGHWDAIRVKALRAGDQVAATDARRMCDHIEQTITDLEGDG